MSSSGNGKDAPPGNPGATGEDGGMAVIRKQRRSSLEKALRGGAGGSTAGDAPKGARPDAAAAWGGVLQREARGGNSGNAPEAPKADKTPRPQAPVAGTGVPRSETPGGDPKPETNPPRASTSASTGSLPRVPASTGSLPRVVGGSQSTAPLPNVTAVRAPSTAQPDELFEPPEAKLHREAGRLADAHEIRESRTRFSMISVTQMLRSLLALALVAACGVLAVLPASKVVERARHQAELTTVIAALVTEIEREPGLAAALAERDLPRLRDMFLRRRTQAAERLRAAGFAEATADTLRVRLTDGGKAIALSAEFTEPDGEVVAATGKTGTPLTVPPVPAWTDVLFGEFLLTTVALAFAALTAVVLLVAWPWWRGRRAAA